MAVLNTSSPVATGRARAGRLAREDGAVGRDQERRRPRRRCRGRISSLRHRVDDDRLAPQDVWRTAPVKLRPA
jgi:hypothetical protein